MLALDLICLVKYIVANQNLYHMEELFARKNMHICALYTRYPIVARALGLAVAFRPSARASKGILHTNMRAACVLQTRALSSIIQVY